MVIDLIRRASRWFVLLVVLFGFGHNLAYAQDGDEPDIGVISHYRTEILFPSALRFFIAINAPPDQITTVSLVVRQESGLQLSLPVSVTQDLESSTEATTDLAYVWELVGSPSVPMPFESLNYLWQIETADGAISRAASEVLFQDGRRGMWQNAGQPPLILHWTSENLAGDRIQSEVLAAYGVLSRRTGRAPLLEFVIYDPGVDLCQTITPPDTEQQISAVQSEEDEAVWFPCEPAIFDQFYANANMIFLQRPTPGYSELQNLLISRMVRDTYLDLWQGTPVPDWFLSGVAGLYRLRPDYNALALARTAARRDDLLRLEDQPGESAQERLLWEAESYLFVLYLADRYGADLPFDLALDVPGSEFDAALAARTGEDFAALWRGWISWVESDAADRAIEWTPYSPITPTPLPTATATPIPPSLAPSNTPTATPTASSTFLADQPSTEVIGIVTQTPLRSPTNTPLPPGSLPTPTPRDTGVQPESGEDETRPLALVAVVFLIGAGVLLLVIVFVMRRRGRR